MPSNGLPRQRTLLDQKDSNNCTQHAQCKIYNLQSDCAMYIQSKIHNVLFTMHNYNNNLRQMSQMRANHSEYSESEITCL